MAVFIAPVASLTSCIQLMLKTYLGEGDEWKIINFLLQRVLDFYCCLFACLYNSGYNPRAETMESDMTWEIHILWFSFSSNAM